MWRYTTKLRLTARDGGKGKREKGKKRSEERREKVKNCDDIGGPRRLL